MCSERRGHTGNGLRDALVRAGTIVVLDLLRHLEQQVAFAQNEQKIQTFTTKATEESFAHRILARRPARRVNDLDPSAGGDPIEDGAVFTVIITNEEAGAFPKRRRFPQLLRHPNLAWMACDRHMHHAS